MQQRHDLIWIGTFQITEVWESGSVVVGFKRMLRDFSSSLMEYSDATYVISKDAPLGSREQSAQRVLFCGSKNPPSMNVH